MNEFRTAFLRIASLLILSTTVVLVSENCTASETEVVVVSVPVLVETPVECKLDRRTQMIRDLMTRESSWDRDKVHKPFSCSQIKTPELRADCKKRRRKQAREERRRERGFED